MKKILYEGPMHADVVHGEQYNEHPTERSAYGERLGEYFKINSTTTEFDQVVYAPDTYDQRMEKTVIDFGRDTLLSIQVRQTIESAKEMAGPHVPNYEIENETALMECICEVTQDRYPYKTENKWSRKYDPEKFTYLSTLMADGNVVCRSQNLYLAAVFDQLRKGGEIDGDIRYMVETLQTFYPKKEEIDTHAHISFRNRLGEYYVYDVAGKFYGQIEDVLKTNHPFKSRYIFGVMRMLYENPGVENEKNVNNENCFRTLMGKMDFEAVINGDSNSQDIAEQAKQDVLFTLKSKKWADEYLTRVFDAKGYAPKYIQPMLDEIKKLHPEVYRFRELERKKNVMKLTLFENLALYIATKRRNSKEFFGLVDVKSRKEIGINKNEIILIKYSNSALLVNPSEIPVGSKVISIGEKNIFKKWVNNETQDEKRLLLQMRYDKYIQAQEKIFKLSANSEKNRDQIEIEMKEMDSHFDAMRRLI